tara:strand:+ start:442 stop:648 length:207 start_codon:yes stop_codon:yes gene_type:complete
MLVVVEVVLLALLLQKVQVEPAAVVMQDLLQVDKDLQAQQTLAVAVEEVLQTLLLEDLEMEVLVDQEL